MMIQQSNRRLVLISAAVLFILLLLLTGHQKREELSDLKDQALEKVGIPRQHPPWLLATISPAFSLQRRTIIRSTWQRLYKNSTRFTTRFVIANATELWLPLIEAENATYGDIIMLPTVFEDRRNANSIKPMTFFSWLVNTTAIPWTFVSKVDDDSFLEPNTFWNKYLQPALDNSSGPPSWTLWGKRTGPTGGYPWVWPQGAFYTLSWDMLQAITRYWNAHGSEGVYDEDALIGSLLTKVGTNHTMIELPRQGAYDYGGEGTDGPRNKDTAWAHKDANLLAGSHGVAVGAFNLHKLKEDEDYLKVAACFDENGLKLSEWADGFVD